MGNVKATELEITLDKVRHMRLDLNAMEDFEKATNKSFWSLKDLSATETKALLWACLRHEEPTLLPGDIGKLVHVGNLTMVIGLLTQLMKEAMPEEKKKKSSPLA